MYYVNELSRVSHEKDIMLGEANQAVIEALKNGIDCYGADLHNELFNVEPYIYYDDVAENTMEDIGVFDCIRMIVHYENDNFGGVYTDFTKPCNVLNMVWYIMGEEVIHDMLAGFDLWDDCWDRRMTEDDCQNLLKYIKEGE